MPLYPEQSIFRAEVSGEEYEGWVASVCRDFAGVAGDELRSLLPTVKEAAP